MQTFISNNQVIQCSTNKFKLRKTKELHRQRTRPENSQAVLSTIPYFESVTAVRSLLNVTSERASSSCWWNDQDQLDEIMDGANILHKTSGGSANRLALVFIGQNFSVKNPFENLATNSARNNVEKKSVVAQLVFFSKNFGVGVTRYVFLKTYYSSLGIPKSRNKISCTC